MFTVYVLDIKCLSSLLWLPTGKYQLVFVLSAVCLFILLKFLIIRFRKTNEKQIFEG